MDSIFKGDVTTPRGRLLAWVDALFIDHALLRLGFSNFVAVAPGKLYRCNHPTPGRLARLTRRHGLRTIINLRGKTGNGSDALSRDMANRLGLGFIDMPISSGAAPPKDRILRLHAVLISMQGPALIHCKSGSDRAGFAAALYVLFAGGTVETALRQLSWRYGHLARSRAGVLDAFFLRYRREAEGRKSFIDWLRQDYDEDALARDFHAGGIGSFIHDKVLARE
jgi:protein tyrosine/serine phosphatase